MKLLERPFVLLQLQQMPAAGQSTKVSVKYEEQPRATEVGKSMNPTVGIG